MPKTKNKKQNFQTRPPIVVILGHVDHGKSSILEAIKDLKITEKESGGITQHIGAYEIEHQGKKITFIDTPGHEAFSAMRSRGAEVADIAVLVIAAEEGLKPQTKEAITYIKKAGLPLIVALNKIDRPEADPEKVKRELNQADIAVESMGGKVPSVETSAKTKKGLDELLELILLTAEIEELKGDISKPGEAVVIESYLDGRRGPTATLLVRDGVLKQGDIVASRLTIGKIRILEDFQGKAIKTAFPSQPVIALGFEKVPQVGENFKVYPSVESAQLGIEKKKGEPGIGGLIFVEEGKKVFNLILKADVLGSLEAIEGILKALPQEKVLLRILKSEVGEISENDVKLAETGKAKLIGFRVKVNSQARNLAQLKKIKILTFEVIYELAQAVRQFMEKSVELRLVREDKGKLKALVIFLTDKNRQIVGGRVTEGELKKGLLIEVFREEEKIGKGKMINLQKNKRDIEKANRGDEVGILFEGAVKIEKGDVLKFYIEERKRL